MSFNIGVMNAAVTLDDSDFQNKLSGLENAAWNFDQIFKDIPATAAKAEEEMRTLYKLSETTSKEMLSTAANQLQAFGFSVEKSLELARAIGKDSSYVSRVMRLNLLSPEIIHAIIAGTLEKDIGFEQLKQAMPLMWNEQKKMFGME